MLHVRSAIMAIQDKVYDIRERITDAEYKNLIEDLGKLYHSLPDDSLCISALTQRTLSGGLHSQRTLSDKNLQCDISNITTRKEFEEWLTRLETVSHSVKLVLLRDRVGDVGALLTMQRYRTWSEMKQSIVDAVYAPCGHVNPRFIGK